MKLSKFALISTLVATSNLAQARPTFSYRCYEEQERMDGKKCISTLGCYRTGIQAYVWVANNENVECKDLGGVLSTSRHDRNWVSVEYLKLKGSGANAECSVTNKSELWAYVVLTAGQSNCCGCSVYTDEHSGWRMYIKRSVGVTPYGTAGFSMKGGYNRRGTALFRVYRR